MTYESIAANLAQVQERIRLAAARAGRAPDEIQLIAVSTTHPASAIRAAYEAGQRIFGENYLQEALVKVEQLADLPIEWHFTGRIQANKTRQIAAHFDWVHGLADAAHARRLSEQRPAERNPLSLCLQVNVVGETSKAGLAPGDVAGMLDLCERLPGIRVRGLMTLPPPAEDEEAQRRPLRALRDLRDSLVRPNCPLSTLSMGMSDDLEAAILEGATMVRIGTAIFGARSYT